MKEVVGFMLFGFGLGAIVKIIEGKDYNILLGFLFFGLLGLGLELIIGGSVNRAKKEIMEKIEDEKGGGNVADEYRRAIRS